MTATNMCSNFGSKWCSPPLGFFSFFLAVFLLLCVYVVALLHNVYLSLH